MILPHSAYAQLTWNLPGTAITNDINFNARPDLVQRPDGSMVLVYTSTRGYSVDIYGRIYSQTTGWSQEYQLTTDPNEDVAPSIASFRNGTMLMVWATNRTGTDDIMMAWTDGTRTWGDQIIVGGPTQDSLPAIAITRYGTVWVFWVRFSFTQLLYNIYYKTLSNGVWSPETLYTTDGGQNEAPQAYATKDDRVWLVWSKQTGGIHTGNWQVLATYYSNGVWAPRIAISDSSTANTLPDISQDRAGNIWVFWSRELAYGSPGQGLFQDLVFSSFSSDNGATFPSTNIQQVTYDPDVTGRDDERPSPAQGWDKSLWLGYQSDPNGTLQNAFNIYVANSSPITGVHDVAVMSISSPRGAGNGANITISVGVRNNGDYAENSLLVTLYSKRNGVESLFGTQTVASIAPGQTLQVPYLWHTRGASNGVYTFRATVSSVPGEVAGNLGDNQLIDGQTILTIPQDVNRDFVVDITDEVLVFTHMFGHDLTYDVTFDGLVNVDDLVSVYTHMFTTVPH